MKNRQKLIQAYKNIFMSEDGKTVMKDLLAISHFTVSTYSQQGDMYAMAVREGRRSLMLDILKRINLSDVKVVELINELKNKEENNNGTE